MRTIDWLYAIGFTISAGAIWYMHEYAVSWIPMLMLMIGGVVVLFCSGEVNSRMFGWGEIDDAKRVDTLWQRIKKFFKQNKP